MHAAILRLMYHRTQIVLHQAFTPALLGDTTLSPLSGPSLTICKHASQSVSHIMKALIARGGEVSASTSAIAFNAGILLLINAYGAKKLSPTANVNAQLEDVQTCVKAMEYSERR